MQPAAYTRQYNFTTFSTNYPTTPLPGVQVDVELNAIKTTLDQVLANLALIQRDDTQLANSSVGVHQLKPELIIATQLPADWATGSVYAVGDVVWYSNALYRCLVAHTSGTFATDLAASKWYAVLDYTDPLGDAAEYASDAETAKTAAEAAQTAAEAAQTAAETAQAGAEAAEAAAAAYTGSISLPLSVPNGGTGAGTPTAARAALGLVIGTDVQAYNGALAYIAALTPASDKLAYFNGASSAALTTLTSFGRSLIDDADASTALSTLGVSTYAKTLLDDADASTALSTLGFSAFAKTIIDDADASAVRTTLGVTAANLGLGSVENKSSATIRGEITSGNVTGALGYTPMNPANYSNVENKSSAQIRNELVYANVIGALGYAPTHNVGADLVGFEYSGGNVLTVYINGVSIGTLTAV